MPTLTHMITAACTHKDQHNMKTKTLDSITPAITTVIGKCVSIYSRKLAALRWFYSLILSNGGATDVCMNRMAKLYDTVTSTNVLRKLDEMARRYNVCMESWSQFSLVIDNVDIYVKPRRETADHSNTMHHMVQAIAVKDRVITSINNSTRLPMVPLKDITPADVYPNVDDISALRVLMVEETVALLGQMPALRKLNIKRQGTHEYSWAQKRKSEAVSMVSCLSTIWLLFVYLELGI